MLGSSVKLYILWAKFWSVFPWPLGRPKHGALEVQEHWIKFLGMDPISAAQLVGANCWLQGVLPGGCDPDLFEAEPPVPTLRFSGVKISKKR